MIKSLWRRKDRPPFNLGVFCCIMCLTSGIILTPMKNQTTTPKESPLRQVVGLTDNATGVSESAQTRKFRIRRNVMQMARMLKCMSGCNPLSYRGYGCYCGYMGSGQPVDEIDRCCLQHDWCYAFISCPQTFIYFVPYNWQCMNPGAAHCGVASVPGVSQKCATQLCECDREFARCVSNYPCPRKKPGCKASNYIMLQTMSNNDV
ncbi:hypothetical protein JTE90_026448 [Oedothorax gibbosus]|uniref:Phospholipase A2 n=1 Tax=Oedothorax gibbosus TaxID=931172 RepID=A0AAV6VPC8_9ARAC|nr:hypothetical protein JTE90_026448 [Oedothorax gibbosus]